MPNTKESWGEKKKWRGFLEAPGRGEGGAISSREDRFGVTGTLAGACRACEQRARLEMQRTPSGRKKSGRRAIKAMK